MPILINRRKFLYAAGAASLLAKTVYAKPERQRWALLSDTHISEDPEFTNRGFFPSRNLKTVVGQVAASHWDQQVVNGDLALRLGQAADYRRFMDLTRPLVAATPLALSLGNHDDRLNAIAALGAKDAVANKWVSAFDAGPFHVIVLDSLFQTNMTAGLLGKLQRDWLVKVLDEHAGKPALVLVHHTLDDSDGSLLDSDRFLKIVTSRKQVKAVFYGHSHVYKYDVQDGLHLVNQPAVGYNFADDQPVGWLEAEFGPMDAQLTLHAIGGNRALDGQTKLLKWR
jgi:3',5'-cyclic AMP phosphodiesterase CpdA